MRNSIIYLAILIASCLNVRAQNYWEEINPPAGVSIYNIYGIDSNNILVGGTEGLYTTYDGGETWEHTIEAVQSCQRINVYNDIFYAFVYPGLYRKIGIDGEWIDLYASKDKLAVTKGGSSGNFYFINDTVIMSVGGGVIGITYDGGYNWNTLYEDQINESFQSIDRHPSGVFFASSYAWDMGTIPGVYKSLDTGITWERIGFENYGNDIIRVNKSGDIYLGCYNQNTSIFGGVFKSIDTGQTWQQLRDDLSVTGLVMGNGDTIYTSSHGFEITTSGVFMSPDGGISWENISSGIEYPKIYKLRLGRDKHLYAIKDGNQDKIYRSKKQAVVSMTDYQFMEAHQVAIYPNPAGNSIHLTHSFNQKINYSIYSSNGQCWQKGQLMPDESQIDINNLNPGFYIIHISNQKNSKSMSFLKQ